jgi:para-aminobenzoate synthetase
MNLTGQFVGTLETPPALGDAVNFYTQIRARNPASYSAFMAFSKTKTYVLSTSPELFVQLSGETGVDALMKPIKGTLRRTPCPHETCARPAECEVECSRKDTARLAAFVADPKERAENLMASQ